MANIFQQSVMQFLERKGVKPSPLLGAKTPLPSPKVGLMDVVKQIPSATKQVGQGIGQFAKDIIMPPRGFSEEELSKAKPTLKEGLLAGPKMGAEIITSLGGLYGAFPRSNAQRESVSKFLQTSLGNKLADAGEKIAEFSKPRTAGEAKAMRAGDIATLLPVGSLKSVKATQALAKEKNIVKAFEGFEDLTTKVLNRLKGKTTTSKQEILDLTNMPELKQIERDLIRNIIKDEGDKIDVPKFAKKVKAELLPLERESLGDRTGSTLYENISLPTELRGKVKNYDENLYRSPITTSAGNIHFSRLGGEPKYFGHTRIEDMADNKTRRVIEVQSDLYQKGGLDTEINTPMRDMRQRKGGFAEVEQEVEANRVRLAKLQQYNDPTAHFRMIREEIKKASQDGKTKLQFPTGETAMKIEGLGGTHQQWGSRTQRARLTPENLVVGDEISRIPTAQDFTPDVMDKWIITDVLGDGKFKAVPKDRVETLRDPFGADTGGKLTKSDIEYINSLPEVETFDISGKVDTSNPIYKFYEKDIGKYLKNKYNAQLITDPQGVKWWEVNIGKDIAKQPVEAFGAFAGVEQDEEGKMSFSPEKAALGLLGAGAIKKVSKAERGFIKSAKEAIPQATKIAGQYIPRGTDELAIKAKNLIKDDIVAAEKLVMTRADDNAVAVASELIKKYGDDAAKATDEVQAGMFYDKAAEIANTLAPKLTEQGRSIQAASILGRLTPEGQLRFAAREIQRYNETATRKIPELTGEQARFISEEMKAIQGMADGDLRAERFQKLQRYIQDLVPTPLIKKITTIWKAGLLTGIKTSGLNMFSNLAHASSEIIKDIPATAVDSVASLFTKERTKSFRTPDLKATKTGFDKGLRYLKTGFDERNIAQKLDYKRVNFGKGKIAKAFQAYTDTVFRVMGSADQPFYYGALSRSLGDQAIAQGMNKGLKGQALKEFADNLIQNPTEEMLRYAVSDAATSVFQNETYLGKAAKQLQNIPLVGEIVVPFGRTPSAVATQILNYTPVGIVGEIASQVQKGSFNQRLFSEAAGRSLTGTGALYLGNELFKKGLMTLDRPTTEREQKLWELEGRKPNSVKIGDSWRSPIVLGPAGNLLLIGGHFNKAFQETGSPSEAMSQAILGSAKSFTEQTFLTGINSLANALNDPERFAESYLGQLTSSLVPTLVSDVARATDPLERRTENVSDRVKARVPGLRQQLEPQVDVLGKEKERIGNPLEVLADPTRPFPSQSTPVIEELRRLTDEGQKVSPTLLGDKKGFKGLSPKENTQLWKRAGEITNEKLDALFKSEKYLKLEEDEKGKIVEDFIDKSKLIARVESAIALTEGLQGEILKAKLSELKAGGLLTRDVFNKYMELR